MSWCKVEKLSLGSIPVGLAISQCFGQMDETDVEKVGTNTASSGSIYKECIIPYKCNIICQKLKIHQEKT